MVGMLAILGHTREMEKELGPYKGITDMGLIELYFRSQSLLQAIVERFVSSPSWNERM